MKKIIYVGSNGFPFGLAQIQRQKILSKLLLEAGFEVTVLSNRATRPDHQIKFRGSIEGIQYLYTSLTARYFKSFLLRNFFKIIGKVNEMLFILFISIISKKEIVLLVNTLSFYQLKQYYLLSRITKTKLVYDYVEYVNALQSPNSFFTNNLKLFDKKVVFNADKIICISNYLINSLKEKKFDGKIIKIPAITDFEIFDDSSKKINKPENYFLFCGAAAYFEVVNFIIKSFDLLNNYTIQLCIVASGTENDINRIRKFISQSDKNKLIYLTSNLPYPELVEHYKNALGLLIPLRPTIKDIARFPHKISEYTASSRPIISTNIGEIKHYFTNNKNAIIAEEFDEEEYANCMNYVIENPTLADKIGARGRELGEKYFHYKSITSQIEKFIAC
jgi:glycosyltransferase involved in cell wall biosynthesis